MTAPETSGPASDPWAAGRCFFEIATADPGRLAVIDASGGGVTYRDLLARVNRVSHGLLAAGLRPRDTLAAVLPNSVEFLVLQLATGQLGIGLVPVNWNFTAPEIAYLLTDTAASAVVAGAPFAATAAAAARTAGVPTRRWYAAPAAPGFRPFTDLAAAPP